MTEHECVYERQPLSGCSGEVTQWTTSGKNKRYLCEFHAYHELDNMILRKHLESRPNPEVAERETTHEDRVQN